MIVVQGTVCVLVWTLVVVCCSAVPVGVPMVVAPAVAPAVTLETAVTIPGLTSTNSAQIPMKYSNADFSSSSDAAHACTHEITRPVNCDDGQKHSVSLFDEQSGRRLSQVLRQRGTRFGQAADCVGAGGPDEDDDNDTPGEGDWTYVVTEGLGFEETEIGMRLRLELELEAAADDVAAGGMAGVDLAEVDIGWTLPAQVGQADDVDVRVTVETVLYTEVLCVPPVVIVVVTGQVVTV